MMLVMEAASGIGDFGVVGSVHAIFAPEVLFSVVHSEQELDKAVSEWKRKTLEFRKHLQKISGYEGPPLLGAVFHCKCRSKICVYCTEIGDEATLTQREVKSGSFWLSKKCKKLCGGCEGQVKWEAVYHDRKTQAEKAFQKALKALLDKSKSNNPNKKEQFMRTVDKLVAHAKKRPTELQRAINRCQAKTDLLAENGVSRSLLNSPTANAKIIQTDSCTSAVKC